MRNGYRSLRLTLLALASFAIVALPTFAIAAEGIYVVTTTNQLLLFSSDTPGSIASSVGITGLQPGESILGIDFRPKVPVGRLYGLGSTSRLYSIDKVTGIATAVGGGPFTPALSGSEFGFDFNPTVDRIRVISDTDQNLRLHPDLGTVVAVDSTLRYPAADPNAFEDPYAVGAGYTNSVDGATSTTLYDVETVLNILTTQAPPNNGQLNTIGSLTVNPNNTCGFDISGATGIAYGGFNVAGVSNLYTVDLPTGAASLVGAIGGGGIVRCLSVFGDAPPTAVEPTTWGSIKGIYR